MVPWFHCRSRHVLYTCLSPLFLRNSFLIGQNSTHSTAGCRASRWDAYAVIAGQLSPRRQRLQLGRSLSSCVPPCSMKAIRGNHSVCMAETERCKSKGHIVLFRCKHIRKKVWKYFTILGFLKPSQEKNLCGLDRASNHGSLDSNSCGGFQFGSNGQRCNLHKGILSVRSRSSANAVGLTPDSEGWCFESAGCKHDSLFR